MFSNPINLGRCSGGKAAFYGVKKGSRVAGHETLGIDFDCLFMPVFKVGVLTKTFQGLDLPKKTFQFRGLDLADFLQVCV